MPLVNDYFSACTNAKLEASDVYLPISPEARADLQNILSEPDSYIYLSISNEKTMEVVKARSEYGTILLDRGQEGTNAVLHRFGSTVCSISPLVQAVVKDLICNYNCCQDAECPCAPVTYQGAVTPNGSVGVPWQGSIVFSGDMPINAAVNSTPSWMSATQQGNAIVLSGTPVAAGTYQFVAAATNCNGTQLAMQQISVTITN